LSEKRLITLTTNWGYRDADVAIFKAQLLTLNDALTVIDISHEVRDYGAMQAAFTISSAFKHFPDNTIHFIEIGNDENDSAYLLLVLSNQFFIARDNGTLSLLIDVNQNLSYKIFKTSINHQQASSNLRADILKFILNLSTSPAFAQSLTATNFKIQKKFPGLSIDQYSLKGNVIHINQFGNIITNISKNEFLKFVGDKKFVVNLGRGMDVEVMVLYPEQASPGDLFGYFNQEGLLELGLRDAPLGGIPNKSLGGLTINDRVFVNIDTEI
jgi:S-adenosylmethionine hydrolase